MNPSRTCPDVSAFAALLKGEPESASAALRKALPDCKIEESAPAEGRFGRLSGRCSVLYVRLEPPSLPEQPEGMPDTPVSLLQRLRSPADRDAWDRFVELYAPLLYHWVRRTGLQEADAADLVQDVMAVLVVQMPRFERRRDGSFHAWLKAVVMNARRDQLRRQRPEQGVPEAFVPDPLEAFIEAEYRGKLALHALRILRTDFAPATWQAVWDWVIEGLPAEQTAARHGLTLGGLYAAKCRVLGRLRAELDELAGP
jgi:RNA polymerase sigma-70 factor (ECF subfamily)